MEEFNANSLDLRGKNFVKHEGVVSNITDRTVTVSLNGNLNCEACNAKAACGVSESNSKEIDVYNITKSLKLDDNVHVVLKKDLALKAVFWAYVFPFILMLTVLLVTSAIFREWIAGLLSIAVLIPYYFILYVLRNSFKKTFKISVLKTI